MVVRIKTEIPGPNSREITDKSSEYEAKAVKRQFPVIWARARGVTVEDVDGNRYLDFTSGILVANIGHSHPGHIAKIQEQAGKYLNCYNFVNPWRVKLAEKLVGLTSAGLNKVFIATTGAEAVEFAVKAAKYYTGRHEIISFYGGYHGKTYGAESLNGKASSRTGFGPAMPGVIFSPYPNCYRCDFEREYPACELFCFKFLQRKVETESSRNIAALIIEPFQGGAGQIMPPPVFVQKLAEWCAANKVVFIMDETQTSFGRTGRMFAFEHFGVEPDLVVAGKGISGGIPITALIGRDRIMDNLPAGSLSSTHGGNPIACCAAVTSIEIIEEEGLLNNSEQMGQYLLEKGRKLCKESGIIGDFRGIGLMAGVEIVRDKETKNPAPDLAKQIVNECIKKGLLLIQPIGFYGNVIRMAPPLVIRREEIDEALAIFAEAVSQMSSRI